MTNVNIEQKSAIGSSTVQIGSQNINMGLSPVEASGLAIKLFYENFPKLQQEAREIVEIRVRELMDEYIKKIQDRGKLTKKVFTDPDMQYVLTQSQVQYARHGRQDMLGVLSDLIAERSVYNDDNYCKIILDMAIDKVNFLNKEHLNYLTLLLFVKHMKFNDVKDSFSLCEKLNALLMGFPVPDGIGGASSYLLMLNIFELNLGKAKDLMTRNYGFDVGDGKEIKIIDNIIPGDYGLSPIGILLAAINYNVIMPGTFDLSNFISGNI